MRKSKPEIELRDRAEEEVITPAVLPFDWSKAVKHIGRKDPVMAKVIKAVGPSQLQLQNMHNCFESLLESIVYQQLTGKAAATILSRVKAIYQNQFPSPQQLIATELELLRSAGLSRAKAMSILDLAEKTHAGVLPQFADLEKMPDEEIIEKLSSVRGVGEWTVQMMLIFKLGRPDVMPIKDYGVRKGFARAFAHAELPSPSQLLHQAEKWRPYRTVASWYLWRVPTK